MDPEQSARCSIDRLLEDCGWSVQDRSGLNLAASRGIAVRELSFASGEPDYTLFVEGKAIGTVEAKPEGHSLVGVAEQSAKYIVGVPSHVPAWRDPLPFTYESTGVETHFTNHLDPEPRSREVFAFHRPETLLEWAQSDRQLAQRLREMPPLIPDHLWRAQVEAITKLERSLAVGRPRALIQMATGSGKTYTAVNFSYRLVKFAKAKRVLFLVDRGNLGEQTLKEFQGFRTPDDGRRFTELYNVQHLTNNSLDPVARVTIATIQRLYSMLRGEAEPAPDLDELPIDAAEDLYAAPVPVAYNPQIPIETFDFIVTDECHRSIYNLWRQVLEYFDATLIGLTATPTKQTLGFFHQNLVMEYGHEKAVADGVNVNYDVYRISTRISEQGSKVEKGFYVDKRDRLTRRKRWELLDDDLAYGANQLDRDVVAEDQIRTVLTAYRDALFTAIFPGRTSRPQDPHLRQGRLPRRRHRAHLPRGLRQGQRLLPEDHLPHDRREAPRPHRLLPQLLQPAHRRHRGHDRHRHRHQAARGRVLHALGALARVLRADEGSRRASRVRHRAAVGHPGRRRQDPLRDRGRGRRLRARQG